MALSFGLFSPDLSDLCSGNTAQATVKVTNASKGWALLGRHILALVIGLIFKGPVLAFLLSIHSF